MIGAMRSVPVMRAACILGVLLGCNNPPSDSGDTAEAVAIGGRVLVNQECEDKLIAVGSGLSIRESPNVSYIAGQEGGIMTFRVRLADSGRETEPREVWVASYGTQSNISIALASNDLSRTIAIPGCHYLIKEVPEFPGPYGDDAMLWLIENRGVGWLWAWTRKLDHNRIASEPRASEEASAVLTALALCLSES